MKRTIRFLGAFVTSLAILICSLAGCNTLPHENTPPTDSQIPLTSQVPAESQIPAITTPEPLQLPVRENPLAVGFQDYYAVRADGMLMAWGSQEFGGFGEEVSFSAAVELLPNTAAVYTSGRGATLAIDRNGGLWAINTTQFNETIPGIEADMDKNPMEPVKVMDGVSMVAMDQFQSLILMQNGELWVNGWHSFGAPWLNRMDSYFVKLMDSVIWATVSNYGGYAITAEHELWGWGLFVDSNDPQFEFAKPKKLFGGMIQVSTPHMALTETGSLFNWNMDSRTGEITQLSEGVQNVSQCGDYYVIKADNTLWFRGVGWSSSEVINEAPFQQVMDGVAYATQGEMDSLAIKRDGSLWLMSRSKSNSKLEYTCLSFGFYSENYDADF